MSFDNRLENQHSSTAQDVAERCRGLGITALHVRLRATGGNKTKTAEPGA